VVNVSTYSERSVEMKPLRYGTQQFWRRLAVGLTNARLPHMLGKAAVHDERSAIWRRASSPFLRPGFTESGIVSGRLGNKDEAQPRVWYATCGL